jgi:hypothetical protein
LSKELNRFLIKKEINKMTNERKHQGEGPRKIARTIEDLPVLKEGYARLVHLAHFIPAERVAESGLDYSKHGMVSSTARIYSREEDVEYTSEDPRFSGDHIRAVVLDVPIDELKLHDGSLQVSQQRPKPSLPGHAIHVLGLVPAKYVVGVVKAEKTGS